MSDINHLGNCERATTINNEDVVLTDSEGKRLKISKADLAEVIRQYMPIATPNRDGFMDRGSFMYRGHFDYNNTAAVNALIASGIYIHVDGIVGTLAGYGVLIVFDAGYYIVQIDFTGDGKIPYRFSSDRGSNWTRWMNGSFT